MQQAIAIDREEKRWCLTGQYRFTEWMTSEPPGGKVRGTLYALAPEETEVLATHSRNGRASARVRCSQIPPEILSWFAHFENKGVKAAIVKRRDSEEYAVLRAGEDHAGGDEPEFLTKGDIFILRKCHGFTLNVEEY
jgi:hypothetical protein